MAASTALHVVLGVPTVLVSINQGLAGDSTLSKVVAPSVGERPPVFLAPGRRLLGL